MTDNIYRVPLNTEFDVFVNAGTVGTPDWKEIIPLTDSPGLSPEPEYTSVRSKRDGLSSNDVLSGLQASGEIKCVYEQFSDDGGTTWELDPALQAIETYVDNVNNGEDIKLQLAIRRPGDGKCKVFFVTGSGGFAAGKFTEGATWSFKFKVQGKLGAWTTVDAIATLEAGE